MLVGSNPTPSAFGVGAHSSAARINSIGDYTAGENATAKNILRLAITHELTDTVLRIRMLTLSNNPWDMAT